MNPQIKFLARKQELFAKITELVSKEGYSNLTVRDICSNLGISTGTFYHYFPEKGDIAWILFSDIDNYFNEEVLNKLTDHEPDNLVTFCIEYGRYIMDNGVETCRCISIAPFNKNNSAYLEEERTIFQILLHIIERGESKGQFKLTDTPLEITRMIMVLIRGYSTDWAKRNGCYDIVEKLNIFVHLFLKSLVN
jgi:AcrR family transcriptional regulator